MRIHIFTYIPIAVLALSTLVSCDGAAESNNDNAQQDEQTCSKVKRALFIGDSITDGSWGHDCAGSPSTERNTTDLNHIYGHGYMYLCASELQSRHPEADIQFFNRGISGHTLQMMADRWDSDCLALKPDLVSVLIGTNDVEYFVGSDSLVADFNFFAWDALYRHTLDTLMSVCPDVRLVLCTPFVAKSGWRGEADNFGQRQALIDSLDVHVAAIASEYGATLVKFDQLFRELEKIQPRSDYWVWDGVHPTAAGHRRMADMWLSETARFF